MTAKRSREGRPLVFGEVLFDRFPDGQELLGGAPFNVAWHLRGWGLDPLFVSRVGDDDRGRRIRTEMDRWGMDTAGVQIDSEHPTGIVEVRVKGEEVAYEIVAERAYDFVQWEPWLESARPSVLYHGTLGLRQAESRRTLERLLQASMAPVFVDVNLRAPWWEPEDVRERLRIADVVKLNEEELDALVPGPGAAAARAQEALTEFELREMCVTQGKRGATLFRSGEAPLTVEPPAGLTIVDPVGAGDAFASVLLLGGILGWNAMDRLSRAQEFAGNVVGLRGALPHHRDFYDPLRSAWSLP